MVIDQVKRAKVVTQPKVKISIDLYCDLKIKK
jgi:hypothetical protein